MEFHQIEYVLAVAQHKNFTRAAEEINVSQSSLSIQISRLEAELRVRLFDRTTRSVSLTPAGCEFLPYADQILKLKEQAQRAMERYNYCDEGTLRVGVVPGGYMRETLELLQPFKQEFPKVNFEWFDDSHGELMHLLKHDQIHMAFVINPTPEDGVLFFPLYRDELCLVVRSDHPLAQKKVITLQELGQETIFLPETSTIHCAVRTVLDEIAPHVKLRFFLLHKTGSLNYLDLVLNGQGGTLIGIRLAKKYSHLGVTFVKITPQITGTYGIIIKQEMAERPLFLNIKKFITQKIAAEWKTV